MSTVHICLNDIFGVAVACEVIFYPGDTPFFNGSALAVSGARSIRLDAGGNGSVTLLPGRYMVRFLGITGNTDTLQIFVPNEEGVYQLAELLGGEAPQDFLRKSQNLSDVADPAIAFDAIKQAATATTAGVVCLASQAEVDSGTNTPKALTPQTFANAAKWATAGRVRFVRADNEPARFSLTPGQVGVGDLVEQADTRAVYQVLDPMLLDREEGYVQIGTRAALVTTLSDGLLAFWNLDEETGVRLDATGNGYDLTDINSTTFVTGKIGHAAQFNGSNYLSGAPLYEAMDGRSFSISFWAQFDPSAQLDQSVNGPGIGFVDRQGSLHLDLWYTDTVGPEGWYIVHWTGSYANVFAPAPLDNGWHHYALTFDVATQTMQLWVDGVMTGSDSSFAPNPTVNGFQLGLADGFLVGCMDEAGVWQRVLSDLEIAQLYNSGNGLSYPFA